MTTIKLRRGTATEWTTANPILAAGEMGIETDTRKFKFGDGTTAWNTLAYASAGGGGGTGDVTAAGDNKFTGKNTFTGEVNITGAPLTVDGLATLNQATASYLNATSITSNGEINAVSIKANGIRSDDIQTTTNKKYLTEEDVDNQTIQIVEGKLHANLDELGNEVNDLSGRVTANEADIATKQDKLSDGNGTKINTNKVDINQGTPGLVGLSKYTTSTATVDFQTDGGYIVDNGGCLYAFLTNRGANNDYEIVIHSDYLDKKGGASDCNINGVRCLPQAQVPTPGEGAQGECWFDTFESPFRVVAVPNGGDVQAKTVTSVNYIKYVIKGTNLTISYSSDGTNYTELYTIAISSTYTINVCIGNSPWNNDIGNKWTKCKVYSDTYIKDNYTNKYIANSQVNPEGVAVATSTAYGLVTPDGTTITSTNGIISANIPDTSNFLDKSAYSTQTMQGSLIVKGGVTECERFRMRSSGTGSMQYTNTTLSKTMFIFRGVSGDYPILIGDASQNIRIDGTKVLFNSTLARKVDDSTEATIIDSSNISTYATGLAFPSNKYTDLTLGATGTTYTAPADGYIHLTKVSNAANQFIAIDVLNKTDNTITDYNDICWCPVPGNGMSITLPISKDRTFSVGYTAGGDTVRFRFVYAEGAQ